MQYLVDHNFKQLCQGIIDENRSIEQWAEVESDDMFQEGDISGGFDATEMEFCFSVHINDKEYWFQISLNKLPLIVSGEIDKIEITYPFK